jgi:hypothetical protein
VAVAVAVVVAVAVAVVVVVAVAVAVAVVCGNDCEDHCLSIGEVHRQVQRMWITRSFR